MTVIPPDANTGSEAHTAEFRNKWGIPFGRPGSAVDYAQCIFSLVTVSRLVTRPETARRLVQNQYVTGAEVVIDGGWLLESGESGRDLIVALVDDCAAF